MKYDIFTEIETKLEESELDRNYFDEIKELKFLFNYVHFHHGSVGLHINGDEISAVNYTKDDDGFVVIKKDSITFAQETGIYKCYFDDDKHVKVKFYDKKSMDELHDLNPKTEYDTDSFEKIGIRPDFKCRLKKKKFKPKEIKSEVTVEGLVQKKILKRKQ